MVLSVVEKLTQLRDVDLDDDPVEDPDDGLVLKDGVVRRGNPPGGGGEGEASGAHAETVGDGTEATFDITHGLGTRQIGGLAAWDVTTAPEERLSPAWLIVDQNTVRVTFPSAPTTDGVRVVVLAAGGETSGGGNGGGDGAGLVLLEDIVLTSSGLITFEDIDQDFASLRIVSLLRSNRTGNTGDVAAIRFNGDTGSNYAHHGSATATGVATGRYARVASSDLASGAFGSAVGEIPFYSLDTTLKTWVAHGYAAAGDNETSFYGGTLTGSTGPVTEIELRPILGNGTAFVAGSRAALWGVA